MDRVSALATHTVRDRYLGNNVLLERVAAGVREEVKKQQIRKRRNKSSRKALLSARRLGNRCGNSQDGLTVTKALVSLVEGV